MEAGKDTPGMETFADVVREIVGDRRQAEVAGEGDISHTYLGQWLQWRVPKRKTLTDFASKLFQKGRITESQWTRLFRAAGFVEPELPAKPTPAPLGISNEALPPMAEEPSGAELLGQGLVDLYREFGRPIPVSFDEEARKRLTPEGARRKLAEYRAMLEAGEL